MSIKNEYTLKMRVDIAATRKRLQETVKLMDFNQSLAEAVYNLAIKSYLKGYHDALSSVVDNEDETTPTDC